MASPVIKVKVTADIRAAVVEALAGLGGLGKFVRPGDKVLIKPNFNTADPFPASSDRDFVSVVADLVHEAGAAEVAVGESCTYFLKTADVMKDWCVTLLTGPRPWLKMINFDEGEWVKMPIPGGRHLKSVSVPQALGQYDRLILLPCLKTHMLAAYTGALKISVGLMKPRERLSLHVRDLQPKVGEMNAVIRPDLIIMDGRKCFITKGPMSGTVREPGLILASTSRVQLDLEGVRIIQSFEGNSLAGIVPEELPQIRRAMEMGVE